MRKCFIVLAILLIILTVSISGCTSENKLSTIEPSEMTLQISDIPENFILEKSSESVPSDVSQWALDHGWKKGYYVIYNKTDDIIPIPDTTITQYIAKFPIDNISLIIPNTVKNLKNQATENVSVDELSMPNVSDSSRMYRITTKGVNAKTYVILFVKKDVYEIIQVYESIFEKNKMKDYETLKQLANVAAAKIK